MMHWQIFKAFFRVGMLGFGGGPSSIPLVKIEVVDKYKWMSNEEFQDVLAIANVLPGPIITKVAGYICYQIKGWLGVANAMVAMILPTAVIMTILLALFTGFKDLAWVQGMSAGVVPVVLVMLAILTIEFLQSAKAVTTWAFLIPFTIGMLIILEVLNIHPAIVIAIIIVISLLRKDKVRGGST
ncbi:chromate transporter [Jeotgalicoccus huakuii]|nr:MULTISPECIES: chromate transporter [unclassified Jeotgalicoccus]MCK1975880.1 chromate transporter [Jeotgalicoccus huakuii]QQD84835.1 chromate transporter [Jeotgalicoccus sp. ATCC 8456]